MADLPSALLYARAAADLGNLSGALGHSDTEPPLPDFTLPSKSPVISIGDSERNTIGLALVATGGERAKAAALLGIGRTTLYRKMKQYAME